MFPRTFKIFSRNVGTIAALFGTLESVKSQEDDYTENDLNFIQYSGSEKNNNNIKNLIKNKRRKSGLQKISKFGNKLRIFLEARGLEVES